MAAGDIYGCIAQILAITWVYRVYLNPSGLRTLGTSTQSKYCLQGYAICSISTGIRYDNVRSAYRRSCNVVENVGNDIDIVGVIISKREIWNKEKSCSQIWDVTDMTADFELDALKTHRRYNESRACHQLAH